MTRAGALARLAALVGAALLLQACATATPNGKAIQYPERPELVPETAEPTQPSAPLLKFSDLAGWNQEDHAAALDAFRDTCGVSKDPSIADVCRRARDLGRQDELVSRAFLEANFRPEQVTGGPDLLTGYFAPRYEARDEKGGAFTEPVRGRPSDLIVVDLTKVPRDPLSPDPTAPTQVDLSLAAVPPVDSPRYVKLDLSLWDPPPSGTRVTGRVVRGSLVPYDDRKAIERSKPETVLAWMRPEDLFFLQIQGSGVLQFPDGRTMKASYAIGNGKRFVGIAAPMRDQGLLADNKTSAANIHDWLADNRGARARAIMDLNPSYVFFNLGPNDGREATGAAGVPLPAGRAIAVDASRHRYGVPYWIDATAPALAGAFPTYRRMVMALDTGGAINGEVRADLYTGTGDAAGIEAGRIRHHLKMYRLVPAHRIALPPTPWGTMAPIP